MLFKLVAVLLVVFVVGCGFGAITCFAHNGSKDLGTTVRELGRGGAFVATEPSVGSLQGNPAALAFLDEPELYIDLRFLQAQVEYSGLLDAQGNTTQYLIPNAGYAEPVSEELAWGIGAFTLTTIGYSVDDFKLDRIFPGIPEGLTDGASTRIRYLTLTPGIAYRLSDDTAIGASFNYSSGETGEEAANQYGETLGYRLYGLRGEGYSLRLGLFHQAEDAAIGAYWRSRSHLDVSEGTVETGPLNPAPNQVIRGVEVTGGDFPEEYGIGISYKLNNRWTAISEYRRYKWSKVRKVIMIHLPQGDPIANPQYWTDQDVYVVAAEYRPDCTDREIWRAGVNYAGSCIPAQYLSPQYPAITEWNYTAGYEREVGDDLIMSMAMVYTAPNSLTTTSDSAFNSVFGGGQPYRAGSESLQFGLGLTWKLGSRCPDCRGTSSCEAGDPPTQQSCLLQVDDAEETHTYSALAAAD